MSPNEVAAIAPPEVTDFLTNYHHLKSDYNNICKQLDDANHHIAALSDQVNSYKDIIADVSLERDYYMRLNVEMRTHFIAVQAIAREADKCFTSGPYRNNGSVPKDAIKIQAVADEINNDVNKVVEENFPSFLQDKDRQEKLNELKEEPKKAWPVKKNGVK